MEFEVALKDLNVNLNYVPEPHIQMANGMYIVHT